MNGAECASPHPRPCHQPHQCYCCLAWLCSTHLLLIQNTPSQQVCLKLAVSVACGSSPRAVDWWDAQDRLGLRVMVQRVTQAAGCHSQSCRSKTLLASSEKLEAPHHTASLAQGPPLGIAAARPASQRVSQEYLAAWLDHTQSTIKHLDADESPEPIYQCLKLGCCWPCLQYMELN